MANGVSLQPPIDANLLNFVRSRGLNLMVDPVVRAATDPASVERRLAG